MMVWLLLRAVLICLVFGVFKTLERMGVLQVLSDSGFDMAQVIWPTVIVVTSIGHSVRRLAFPMISVLVEGLMFRRVVHLRPGTVMLMVNPWMIVFTCLSCYFCFSCTIGPHSNSGFPGT